MYSTLLNLENLNQRKYIHGTSIVSGVMRELVDTFTDVCDFKIRLLKPLFNLPILYIGELSSSKPFATGSFKVKDTIFPFYLLESTEPCIRHHSIDESKLEQGVKIENGLYSIQLLPSDNIMVAWSAIERPCNFALFNSLGLQTVGKQMWFTRMELDNLKFLEDPVKSVGSSFGYNRLSEFCIQRKIYFNGLYVGTRTAVYA